MFQNDNEMYEPTSDAERARLNKISERFTQKLENSGAFEVKEVTRPWPRRSHRAKHPVSVAAAKSTME